MSPKMDLFSAYNLTDEDKAEVARLAKDPGIGERVCYGAFFLFAFSLSFSEEIRCV